MGRRPDSRKLVTNSLVTLFAKEGSHCVDRSVLGGPVALYWSRLASRKTGLGLDQTAVEETEMRSKETSFLNGQDSYEPISRKLFPLAEEGIGTAWR